MDAHEPACLASDCPQGSDRSRGAAATAGRSSAVTAGLLMIALLGGCLVQQDQRLSRLEAAAAGGPPSGLSVDDWTSEALLQSIQAAKLDRERPYLGMARMGRAGLPLRGRTGVSPSQGVRVDSISQGTAQSEESPAGASRGRSLEVSSADRASAEQAEVVRFEARGIQPLGSTWPEEQSQGIALDIEQPGAAMRLWAPIGLNTSNSGRVSLPSPPPSASELLLFATHVRSPTNDGTAAQSGTRWLADSRAGVGSASSRMQRAPSCRSLISDSRCAMLNRSSEVFKPALVVAGDLVVTGRAMSPTVDALVELMATLNATMAIKAGTEDLSHLERAVKSRLTAVEGNLTRIAEEYITADQTNESTGLGRMSTMLRSMRSRAMVSNTNCDDGRLSFKANTVLTVFPSEEEASVLPGLRDVRTSRVDQKATRNSGLPFSAFSGVPKEWGQLNSCGIRAHAAVTVVIPKAAAFGGGDRPRKYAWMYVTGGFDGLLGWENCRSRATAMDHSYRLDLVSMRWEQLPQLPTARADHSMVWVPEMGLVLASPGTGVAVPQVGTAGSLSFPSGNQGMRLHALAVPEAFNASIEWSRPTQLGQGSPIEVLCRHKKCIYEHNSTNLPADGGPHFTPASDSWKSRNLTISAGRWQPVADLATTPIQSLSVTNGLTSASLAVLGKRVFVFGGLILNGSITSYQDSARPNFDLFVIDLGNVSRSNGNASAMVRVLCTFDTGTHDSMPYMSAAVFPVPLALSGGRDQLMIAAGARLTADMKWDTSAEIVVPFVLDLEPGMDNTCQIDRREAPRAAWRDFGSAQLSTGEVATVGGRRTDPTSTEAEIMPATSVGAIMKVSGGDGTIASLAHPGFQHSLVGGTLSAIPAMPLALPSPGIDVATRQQLLSQLDDEDLGPGMVPITPVTATEELWWLGGDDSQDEDDGRTTLVGSESAVLRRLGGHLSCGELGKARAEAALLARATS